MSADQEIASRLSRPDEHQQKMCWQLNLARADDEEKMPQLHRIFTPNLSKFPEKFITTSLSVDDLVKHIASTGC